MTRWCGGMVLLAGVSVGLGQALAQRGEDAADEKRRGAWQPDAVDRSAYRDIVDFNIFRYDRQRLAEQVDRVRNPPDPVDPGPEPERQPEPVVEKPPPDPDASWRLAGISHNASGGIAFIEHTATGELSRVTGPAEFSVGEITAIGYDALMYVVEGEQRVIRIGETLVGTRVIPEGAGTSPRRSSSDEPKPGSLEDRLRALRERRAREQGNAPPKPETQEAPQPSGETQPKEGDAETEQRPPNQTRSIAQPETTAAATPAIAREATSNNL